MTADTPRFTSDRTNKRWDDGESFQVVIDGTTYEARVHDYPEDNNPPDTECDGFWPSEDPKDAGYIGENPSIPFAVQMDRAKRVMRHWKDRRMKYVGMVVRSSRAGIQLVEDYLHAVWRIEMNYPTWEGDTAKANGVDNSYLLEVANELLPACIEDTLKLIGRFSEGDSNAAN